MRLFITVILGLGLIYGVPAIVPTWVKQWEAWPNLRWVAHSSPRILDTERYCSLRLENIYNQSLIIGVLQEPGNVYERTGAIGVGLRNGSTESSEGVGFTIRIDDEILTFSDGRRVDDRVSVNLPYFSDFEELPTLLLGSKEITILSSFGEEAASFYPRRSEEVRQNFEECLGKL